MFLLVPAYPGCPRQAAVKWLLLLPMIVARFSCGSIVTCFVLPVLWDALTLTKSCHRNSMRLFRIAYSWLLHANMTSYKTGSTKYVTTLLPREDRATTTGNMQRKFGKVWTRVEVGVCVRAHGRRADRHALHNTPLSYQAAE